nr:PHD finger protein At2g01810-like [Tanacetum cinerariifolium]
MALEPCKKRKQKIYEFKSFGKSIPDYTGAFRDNVRLFLDEYGEKQNHNVWSTLLLCESNGAVFPIYVIEECLDQFSEAKFCAYCKIVGWAHHFVCKRRYRFMIPTYGHKQTLIGYDQKNSMEADDTHILHGLIHCNGFGHLISINKLQLDSTILLTESDVMNLWDSICYSLKTRKVSVADVKLDRSMEIRLIYGVAFKSSWFGNWGYKFGAGSFGVTEDKYRGAVQFLAGLDLDMVIDDFKSASHGRKIERIICKYRHLSESRLSSMSDLIRSLIELTQTGEAKRQNLLPARKLLKYEHPTFVEGQNPILLEEFLCYLMDEDCRWPQRKVEYSLEMIVQILKQKNGTMSINALRESAKQFVGDMELLDFVLKFINVLRFENYIIRRVVNSCTQLVEFEICKVADDSKNIQSVSLLSKLEARWPKERLEKTAQVIANILKEQKIGNNGKNDAMSRKDLRDMANKYIGDTGLIDFVLKSINNLKIGNHIITRTKNPVTRLIEFHIRDHKVEDFSLEKEGDPNKDMLFIYRNVLLGYQWWSSVTRACQVLLNSKYFVKEWDFGVGNKELMLLTCRVLPSFDELETELTRPLPPGEVVIVTPWMTIGQLREKAQSALRDTYCLMDRFVVSQIGGLKGMQDDVLLSYAVLAGEQVWVRGFGLDLDTVLRYEGGDGYAMESKVECLCGARDDDGERMVACDECNVWRHTKCSGIEDDELAPAYFVCSDCDAKSKSELLSQ